MQNFCTQIDTAPIGVQEALQENVCVYVRLQKEEKKTRIACTLVANSKCYDGGVVACEEVFPSSFYIPWMSF
jgi:hypothetical protein